MRWAHCRIWVQFPVRFPYLPIFHCLNPIRGYFRFLPSFVNSFPFAWQFPLSFLLGQRDFPFKSNWASAVKIASIIVPDGIEVSNCSLWLTRRIQGANNKIKTVQRQAYGDEVKAISSWRSSKSHIRQQLRIPNPAGLFSAPKFGGFQENF